MQTGCNVISSTRFPEKQIVCYMKPIQLPPTKLMLWKKPWSVQLILQKQYNQDKYLSHTILQLLRLQKEYNLENPQSMIIFSLRLDLFILNFLFFSSPGKFIEGSGGPYILSECDIVAMRSMNKFLKGKMYNRCRRGTWF